MKNLLALSILLILSAVAVIGPNKLNEAKLVYEQRMVALVDAIEKSLRLTAGGDQLKIGVYRPKIGLPGDRGLLAVTGVVGVSAIGGTQLFEPFSAKVRNACETILSTDCLRVDTLSISGAKLIEDGGVAGRIREESSVPADKRTQASPTSTSNQASQPAKAVSVSRAEGKPRAASANNSEQSNQPADARSNNQANGETRGASPSDTQQASQPAKAIPDGPAGSGPLQVAAVPVSQRAGQPATAAPKLSSGRATTDSPGRTPGDARGDLASRSPSAPQSAGTPNNGLGLSDRIARIQRALKKLGYGPGPADNVVGPQTLSAILAYQRRYGLEPDGKASLKLLKHIRSNGGDDAY